MVDTIYIEEQVRTHQRTEKILARYPKAKRIDIERYGEVFNSNKQNFRLQKQNPSLILAHKHNNKVLPTPSQYETGGGVNYYFSHMLNCIYDCRYCFLQGMYRSANYLLFINYEDFITDISGTARRHAKDDKPVWFFSGYDCDSLAYEPVTGFANVFLKAFETIPNSVLELRTKSTQIRSLLQRPAMDNVVVAYSLSPHEVASSVEIGAPSFDKRLTALSKLQLAGWRIGIRFDPIIWHESYQEQYQVAIDKLFSVLDANKIDSVTLGGFRLPRNFYKTMQRLYPEHWLFSAGLSEQNGLVSYRHEIEQQVLSFVAQQLQEYIKPANLYLYPSGENNI